MLKSTPANLVYEQRTFARRGSADAQSPSRELLGRRLAALAPLMDEDLRLLDEVALRHQLHAAGAEIPQCERGRPKVRVLLSGWACRARMRSDGRRMIFRFYMPGDVIGLADRHNPLVASTYVMLTAAETADAAVLGATMREAPVQHARLAAALQTAVQLEEAAMVDHLMRLGHQNAYERTAHLLLELHHRATAFTGSPRFALPLTQEQLGDSLGLSIVHVNRTLQTLRRQGLLVLRDGVAELPDVARLHAIADFEPPPVPHRGPHAFSARNRLDA